MLKRKSTETGDRPLIDIGYKYNVHKVISLIDTEDAGSTKDGITYLSNFPDLFANVAIIPVSQPLVMSKLLGSANEFYPPPPPNPGSLIKF